MTVCKKSNGGFRLPNHRETEEYKFHQRALERFKQMTVQEKFQTMVDVGIYTPEGGLTERYGGVAHDPPDSG